MNFNVELSARGVTSEFVTTVHILPDVWSSAATWPKLDGICIVAGHFKEKDCLNVSAEFHQYVSNSWEKTQVKQQMDRSVDRQIHISFIGLFWVHKLAHIPRCRHTWETHLEKYTCSVTYISKCIDHVVMTKTKKSRPENVDEWRAEGSINREPKRCVLIMWQASDTVRERKRRRQQWLQRDLSARDTKDMWHLLISSTKSQLQSPLHLQRSDHYQYTQWTWGSHCTVKVSAVSNT